jgi:hypothetical protein
MSFYNISYDQKAVELLPPDKRGPINVSWVRARFKELRYLRDKILGDYKEGADYPLWSNSFDYTVGDKVIYGQGVYVSLVDANTDVPTFTSSWELYQDIFIGVDERVKFNHCKLVLEYALNKRFHGNFVQPPNDGDSDIYIQTNGTNASVFVVGGDESNSSVFYADKSDEVIINAYSSAFQYNFTIYVLTSIWTALASDDTTREKIIRSFVDQYNTIGIFYDIQTY